MTVEHRKNISKALIGHVISEETRIKISNSLTGTKLLEETKNKISRTLKELYEKGLIINSMKNKKHTQESKNKMSKSSMGQIPWNKNKKNCFSEETLKKKSESMKGKNTGKRESMTGKKHHKAIQVPEHTIKLMINDRNNGRN